MTDIPPEDPQLALMSEHVSSSHIYRLGPSLSCHVTLVTAGNGSLLVNFDA